jgi:hypothetical protein
MQDLAKDTASIIQIKTKSQQIKHIIHNYAAFDISTINYLNNDPLPMI